MRLYGRDRLWNPNQFDFVRVVSIQNPLAQVKILTKTRPCQSKEAVAETCSRDLLPGMLLWIMAHISYHGSIGSRLPLLKTPIPASYIAVENAVGVVRERCYRDDQTPVLKSEQFRYWTEYVIVMWCWLSRGNIQLLACHRSTCSFGHQLKNWTSFTRYCLLKGKLHSPPPYGSTRAVC